ncbi:MAG: TonB-dependent receptor, partial [Deltaproteobacteria bacterium]|nr:TonB-dependent receptor [Deltaproteobacteria bacterium]
SNAGAASLYGAEIEISARPLPPLQLSLGIALLETELDEYIGPDPATTLDTDFSGNELPFAPKLSVNASASYTIVCGDVGFLSLYALYDWRDKTWSDAANQEVIRLDDLGKLDARISFETSDGTWQFQVYGRNITDEEYYNNKFAFSSMQYANPDTVIGYKAEPATYGFRVRYRY